LPLGFHLDSGYSQGSPVAFPIAQVHATEQAASNQRHSAIQHRPKDFCHKRCNAITPWNHFGKAALHFSQLSSIILIELQ
jgi:hypothetical protein